VEWAGRWCGEDMGGTEDWVKGHGGRVDNGLVKVR